MIYNIYIFLFLQIQSCRLISQLQINIILTLDSSIDYFHDYFLTVWKGQPVFFSFCKLKVLANHLLFA